MSPNPLDDETEKPLDPAVERVRRKLVRFVVINLGLLFAALIAVVVALFYQSGQGENADAADVPEEELLRAEIALPQGATVEERALDGERLVLHVRLAEGGEAVFVYDIAAGRMIGRHDLRFVGD